MTELLQFTFLGLGKGAVYASLALALVIVYRTTGVVNFAQGEMALFSTFLTWTLWDAGLPVGLAVVGSAAVSFVGAAAVERFLVRPVGSAKTNPLGVVIVTVGLFLFFGSLAVWLWGSKPKAFPQLFGEGALTLFGASVEYQTLGSLGVLAVEVVAAVPAPPADQGRPGHAGRRLQRRVVLPGWGVPVGRMLMIGWGLAAALGAVAGTLAVDTALDASLMVLPLIYAFAAGHPRGGFDSPVGAVVGGLVVGLVAELSAAYIDWIGQDLRMLPAFLLILVVLLVRPQGLFGKAEVTRV